MKTFLIPTEDFIKTEKTEVVLTVSAGSSVQITVKNNQGFAIDDYVILKKEGTEQAHIAKIIAVTDNDKITLDTLKYDLNAGDPVTKILFNQRKIYGCNTVDGTYTELTGSPIDIEVDRPDGTLFEYSGSDYSYFKSTYYNSTTLTETSLDDAIAISTSETAHYCSIDDIRQEAGFTDNNYISAGRIDALRAQAEGEVKGSISSVYALPITSYCETLRIITKLLAAGWLMCQEYGEEASGTSKDGVTKVKQAREMLKAIREHKLRLYDRNDKELTLVNNGMGTIDGYPDDSAPDSEKAQFTIDQKF